MYTIRLDKKNKTLKIVNRKENIRLKLERDNVRLQHTGRKGPKGDKGDTGVSTFVRAHHHADADFARPDAVYVEWVGSVAPLNATTEDTWINTQ